MSEFAMFLFGAGIGVGVVYLISYLRRLTREGEEKAREREKLMQKYFPSKVYKRIKLDEAERYGVC